MFRCFPVLNGFRIQVKKHVKNGKNVSMGFGFIEFDSMDTAMNVCRDLQVIFIVHATFKPF